MNAILTYILECNLYLLLFVLFYAIFLRKEKSHLLNRIFLLSFLVLPFLIPVIPFQLNQEAEIVRIVQLDAITVTAKAIETTEVGWNLPSFITLIYLTGALVSIILLLNQLLALRNFIKERSRTFIDGILQLTSKNHSASSFFNVLLWDESIPEENKPWVLHHERVHINEKHSFDILLCRIARIFAWFNPAIYYLENLMEENHEFRADEVVAQKFNDIQTYSTVLLGQAMGVNHSVFTHHFSKPNFLKTRIKMLHKKQSKNRVWAKYALILPMLGLAVFIHSCAKDRTDDPAASSTPKPQNAVAQGSADENVLTVAEKMPEFPGGNQALIAHIVEHVKYPESARAEKIEGKVFVEFVIDKSGAVTSPSIKGSNLTKNGEEYRANNEELNQAAIAAVTSMPDWTPGEQSGEIVKVKYVLPIQFRLD